MSMNLPHDFRAPMRSTRNRSSARAHVVAAVVAISRKNLLLTVQGVDRANRAARVKLTEPGGADRATEESVLEWRHGEDRADDVFHEVRLVGRLDRDDACLLRVA